jgi:hypothetical protein
MSNDWMNDQLRERAGTTVRLGNDANDAIRQALQPALAEELGVSAGQAPVAPEPPTTAPLSEWRKWAEGAAPAMDDQGRLPTEDGYTRPAADSFVAMVARKARRAGGAGR